MTSTSDGPGAPGDGGSGRGSGEVVEVVEVVEHAVISVLPGREAEFEAAFAEARLVISAARGCRWVQLSRGVERPSVYLLLVGWESLEDHTDGFRGSPAFVRWRELIGPSFAAQPEVEHVVRVSPPPV